jgi:hypothetical protein
LSNEKLANWKVQEIISGDIFKLADVGGASQLLVVCSQVIPRCETEQVLPGILGLQEIDLSKDWNFFIGVAVDGDAIEWRHPEIIVT